MSLYKYRNIGNLISNEIDPHLKNLLVKGELYFSSPKDFNDPFDSLFTFHTSISNQEVIQHLRDISIPEEKIKNLIRTNGIKKLKEKVLEINEKTDLLRLYCLSSNCINTLLWSHYAQNHYGICIGFKTYIYDNTEHLNISNDQIIEFLPNYPKKLIPVIKINYSEIRPAPFSIILNKSEDLKSTFLTKSKDWEYEEEKRIIILKKYLKRNPLHINRSQIEEIIFGLRTPKVFEEKVINILQKFENIRYYKIRIRNGSYSLFKEKYTS